MFFLEAKDVVKQYSNHLALNGVNVQVPENSIFGLLGPNGAGKTTLIRIINKITMPDSGEIILQGQKLKPSDIAHIGYLPEERGLYKKMKVGEQALYLAQLKGMSRHEALSRLKYWFEKLEIQPWWDKKVEELSKGMQQKVQFVVTVLHRPKLLIFDEPFSGFDPINANILKNEILDLRKEGATILFSTHNMSSVEEICDHITLINRSQIILHGGVDTIRHEYKENLFKLQFKGAPDKLQQILGEGSIVKPIATVNHIQEALIRMTQGVTSNQLLGRILDEVEIIGFNEILPSMNEVFIKVVEQSNLAKN